MKITVNGREETLLGEMNLVEFLSSKNLDPDTVVIEHNYQIIKKENWSAVIIREGDNLEVLRFVGGG